MSWSIFTIWLITFTRNAFDALEISADLFAYICDVTFHDIWTKPKSSSSRRSHRKTYRSADARIYHSCVELAIFIGKGSVHLKFSFETHRMINFVVATRSRWRRSGAVRFHTPSLPQKLARAFSRPGVEATAILATMITCWHGNRDCGCSRFKFYIAFNEQNIGCCGNTGGIML